MQGSLNADSAVENNYLTAPQMIAQNAALENCKLAEDSTACKNEINAIYKKLSDLQDAEKYLAYKQSGAPHFTQDGIGAFLSNVFAGYHSDGGKSKNRVDAYYFRENNKNLVIQLLKAMYPQMSDEKVHQTADEYIRRSDVTWRNATENAREARIVSVINASTDLATEIATLKTGLVKNNIKLKNGYYEVANMKISKSYYERLWKEGRPAPFLQAREVLRNNPKILPDDKAGFFRYEALGLELIYNPKTGEIWHIQPQRLKRK